MARVGWINGWYLGNVGKTKVFPENLKLREKEENREYSVAFPVAYLC